MKKFAIIGLGSRGQMFAKLLEKEKDVILTAVAEPVYASRQLAFTRFGVPLSVVMKTPTNFLHREKSATRYLSVRRTRSIVK